MAGTAGTQEMLTVYTTASYPTKRTLRDEVAYGIWPAVYREGFGARLEIPNGVHVIVGPGPYDRKWYGQVKIEDGCIVKVVK